MALQWMNVLDLPGAAVSSGGWPDVTIEGNSFVLAAADVVYGESRAACTPQAPGSSYASIDIYNAPGLAGATFTGRQRITVLENASTGGGGPWGDYVHTVQGPGGGSPLPIGAYIADNAIGGVQALCMTGATLNGAGGLVATIYTSGGRKAYSFVSSQRYRWTLELEVDIEPPPDPEPELFWQDFVASQERQTP